MLADRSTRQALQRLSQIRARSQAQAWAALPEADRERARAAAARQRVLDQLPHYLDRLATQAEANGLHVHRANSAQEANRIVVEAVRATGTSSVVRNHAPLLDEIAFDRAAAANHISVVHVHPGDHVVELIGSRSGHPIWPAAHLRKEQVSAAMQSAWRVPATLDIDLLAATARSRLRPSLLAGRIAVMGLNFAVAETGSLVCLDNDGHNANLFALANTIVCLLSIEHVVADMADLHALIQSFARSAWGRPLPAYVTQWQRPAPSQDAGPNTIHLVLVDNGRTRVMAQGFGEALRCIGCGACHNVCPVYVQTGAGGYGNFSHTGPIGAILNPLLVRQDLAHEQPFLSSECGACRPACPVDIDLPGLLHRQRQRSQATARERLIFWLWRRLLSYPRVFVPALRMARWLRNLRADD